MPTQAWDMAPGSLTGRLRTQLSQTVVAAARWTNNRLWRQHGKDFTERRVP